MIRSTMRTLLRHELNEASADNWTDAELNDLLNYGLQWVQTYLISINPSFCVFRYLANRNAGDDLVPAPAGMLYEWRFERFDEASSSYKRVKKHPGGYEEMVARGSGTATGTGLELNYARVGRFFAVHPVPTTNLTNGWRVWFMPTLDMAADSDVPDIEHPLHYAPVLKAKLLAIGETAESAVETRTRLADEL